MLYIASAYLWLRLSKQVPAARLYFFNVKDGWEPLCKILGCPVPDEPFSHANDRVEVQKTVRGMIRSAVTRWMQLFSIWVLWSQLGSML